MDPNANLKEQLELAEKLQRTHAIDDCQRLAELVLALNEWIEQGGFLPESWSKAVQ